MILIVQSLWNEAITDKLAKSAERTLTQHHVEFETIQVPGALEIPLAVNWAATSPKRKIDGVIACGTIVRGETYHFEIVANDSARALMELSLKYNIPIANALLATENIEQAIERTGGKHGDKGEEAAKAVLQMLELRRTMA